MIKQIHCLCDILFKSEHHVVHLFFIDQILIMISSKFRLKFCVTAWRQDSSYIVRWGEIIRRADYSCGLFGAAVSAHPNEPSYCYNIFENTERSCCQESDVVAELHQFEMRYT